MFDFKLVALYDVPFAIPLSVKFPVMQLQRIQYVLDNDPSYTGFHRKEIDEDVEAVIIGELAFAGTKAIANKIVRLQESCNLNFCTANAAGSTELLY